MRGGVPPASANTLPSPAGASRCDGGIRLGTALVLGPSSCRGPRSPGTPRAPRQAQGGDTAPLPREMLPQERLLRARALESLLQLSPPGTQSQPDKSRLEEASVAAAPVAGEATRDTPRTQVGSDSPASAGYQHSMYTHLTATPLCPLHGTGHPEASGTSTLGPRTGARGAAWLTPTRSGGLLGAAAASGGASNACAQARGQTAVPTSASGTPSREVASHAHRHAGAWLGWGHH